MRRCEGPCLSHCVRCSPATAALAYVALAYTLASLGYLVMTRRFGTPFVDSLTPAQRELKARSAARRRDAFLTAALLATALLLVLRPLRPT